MAPRINYLKKILAHDKLKDFYEFRMESRSPLRGYPTLDESISNAKRSKIARVYRAFKIRLPLSKETSFFSELSNILTNVSRKPFKKTTRLLEVIGIAEKKSLAKKC